MNESVVLLDALQDALGCLDEEIVGGFELTGEAVIACRGRLRLLVEIINDPGSHPSMAHCHVLASIDDQEPLDACVVGIDSNRERAIQDAAQVWAGVVAPCLFSTIHDKPVLEAQRFDGDDPRGVPGCQGFVGPVVSRFVTHDFDLGEAAQLFEFAGAMAKPSELHIAKVTLDASSSAWKRTTEVDGHQSSYADQPPFRDKQNLNPNAVFPPPPPQGISIQYAVFWLSAEAKARRATLDQAIRDFVFAFAETQNTEAAAAVLLERGVQPEMVDAVLTFVPVAATRMVLEGAGCQFSSRYVEVGAAGASSERELMSVPAFARTRALQASIASEEGDAEAQRVAEALQGIATTSSEFHCVNESLYAGSKLENLVVAPLIVPTADATEADLQSVIDEVRQRTAAEQSRLRKKKWWKFW